MMSLRVLRLGSALACLAFIQSAAQAERPSTSWSPQVLAQKEQPKASPSKQPQAPAAQKPPAPAAQPPSVPPPEVLLMMLRTTLIAVDQANRTMNYSVLHALGGPMLHQATPDKLAESFAAVRNAKVTLEPVAVLNPQLTQPATIDGQGHLILIGFFPSQPLQVRFQVAYEHVEGVWKLGGVNLGLLPVTTAGTAAAAPNPAPEAKPAQPATAKTAPAKAAR